MNYEKLWKDLKDDLERWDRQGGADMPEIEDAGDIWEIMQKREEQSY